MQSTNNRTYITSGIVAVIVIALLVGSYLFDHRFDSDVSDNQATSTLDISNALGTSTFATSSATSGSNKAPVNSTPTTKSPQLINLDTFTLTTKSDISSWNAYTNNAYKFTLKYPAKAAIRKFIDGKNVEYGVALTLESSNSHFVEKYFELVIDTGKTTVCDALLQKGMVAKSAVIGGVSFIRIEYNDGASHVIEYNVRANGACYSGNLRLNGASGVVVSSLGAAEIATETQVLEDIMSTFRFIK